MGTSLLKILNLSCNSNFFKNMDSFFFFFQKNLYSGTPTYPVLCYLLMWNKPSQNNSLDFSLTSHNCVPWRWFFCFIWCHLGHWGSWKFQNSLTYVGSLARAFHSLPHRLPHVVTWTSIGLKVSEELGILHDSSVGFPKNLVLRLGLRTGIDSISLNSVC